jgi:phosphopantothenate synthetase
MMMGMLNPNQKQMVNQLQNKSNEEQAQAIAEYCNKNNISKEQLQNIVNMFNKRR